MRSGQHWPATETASAIYAHLDVAGGPLAHNVFARDGLSLHVYPRARGLQVVGLGVDLADGLRDGAVLHRSNRGGGQHRGEEEEVSRRHRRHLELARIDLLQESVGCPTRSEHHNLWFWNELQYDGLWAMVGRGVDSSSSNSKPSFPSLCRRAGRGISDSVSVSVSNSHTCVGQPRIQPRISRRRELSASLTSASDTARSDNPAHNRMRKNKREPVAIGLLKLAIVLYAKPQQLLTLGLATPV